LLERPEENFNRTAQAIEKHGGRKAADPALGRLYAVFAPYTKP
jgi:hypothetical protein